MAGNKKGGGIMPPRERQISLTKANQAEMLIDLQLNDLLRLRKPHPCGSYEWTVVRLGADIGLECKGCGRRVLLTRRELRKRLKRNLTKEHG